MPEATASHVRVEIETRLSDSDISDIIERVGRDINREYDDPNYADTEHQRDFEATLTALRIATGRDPTVSDESLGARSQTYDADRVEWLRTQVQRLDPGDAFGHEPARESASFEAY